MVAQKAELRHSVSKRLLGMFLAVLLCTLQVPVVAIATGDSENQSTETSVLTGDSSSQSSSPIITTLSPGKPSTSITDIPDYVTPVRLQTPWNTCWAFSSTAAMEANLVRNGKESADNYFLSPKHLAWFAYSAHGEGNQEGEGNYVNSGVQPYDVGGNSQMVMAMLSSGRAPAMEKDAQKYTTKYRGKNRFTDWQNGKKVNYSANDDWSLPDTALSDVSGYQMKAAYFVDTTWSGDATTGHADQDAIKAVQDLVSNYGAATVDFYSDHSKAGDTTTADKLYVYNKRNSSAPNHSVAIVGWNDDFDPATIGASGPKGAWICKNSWGSNSQPFPDWNDQADYNGYFYLSYEDCTIKNITAYEMVEANTNFIDQYDYLGRLSQAERPVSILDKQAGYANMFKAQQNQTVTHVSLELFDPDCTATIQVYKLNADATSPTDGKLVSTQTEKYSLAGSYKVKLNTNLALKEGERYSVIEKVQRADGKYAIPMEAASDDSSQGFTQKVVVNKGESWLSFDDGKTWIDATDGTNGKVRFEVDGWSLGNVMIKAYSTGYNPNDKSNKEDSKDSGDGSKDSDNTDKGNGTNNNTGNNNTGNNNSNNNSSGATSVSKSTTSTSSTAKTASTKKATASTKSASTAAKTADVTPLIPVVALACAGLVTFVAVRRRAS